MLDMCVDNQKCRLVVREVNGLLKTLSVQIVLTMIALESI